MISERLKGAVMPREDALAEIIRQGIRVGEFVGRIRRAARERAQLLALSDRELHDIGISRVDALREAERPLWRSAFAGERRWRGGSP